ncbi:hypothetical protein B0H13DRAFT_1885333 [Mycena leptocephala]|nr:hypothetical protein B0H13DRAFT_1885333 [Mycena leptocephala]
MPAAFEPTLVEKVNEQGRGPRLPFVQASNQRQQAICRKALRFLFREIHRREARHLSVRGGQASADEPQRTGDYMLFGVLIQMSANVRLEQEYTSNRGTRSDIRRSTGMREIRFLPPDAPVTGSSTEEQLGRRPWEDCTRFGVVDLGGE